ncbi:hypothetical protein C8P68_10210 [Mucilaginibacter yixingensis]|uniref:Uncharacterized protein n=1 Tax=Mucilaginibacter yixingensis TaxID=1295612 RepID=A0A2T5JC03_9SPHI|nr:hypothetical protein [Mucilaginibacter yixingensis]PTQ99195.1 hypothetical protein C8P68_10210 [Mucilaginibacter yixingensis]
MDNPAVFLKANLGLFGFQSKQELIEQVFLQSLIESYGRVLQTVANENDIRDRFIKDIYTTPSKLRDWLQQSLMYLDWENWKFTAGMTLARADISFKLTGCEFIIECKRLKSADKAYIDEGLERFRTLHYAQGHEFAGMIGFVINNNTSPIMTGLQTKVNGHYATTTPFSSSTFSNWTNSFLSSHVRTDASSINVYHLFFEFNGVAEDLLA